MSRQSLATSSLTGREEPDLQTVKDALLAFYPLSSQNILDIQPYLLRAEAEINNYQAEIDRVSLHSLTKKYELEYKRNELARIHADAVWRCNPISCLVPDILCEIFRFLQDAEKCSLRDCKSAILPLAQTCRLWRHVAFSQPRLWSSISLCTSYYTSAHESSCATSYHDRVARAVRFHLDRSSEALLSVHIACEPCPAYDALLAERHRWRECYIQMPIDHSGARLQSAQYPSLEHLAFDMNEGTHAFEDSPRLRSYVGPVFDTRLPWGQLTSLTINRGNLSGDLFTSVLSECGGLEYLEFDTSYMEVRLGLTRNAFHLPRLRKLVLTCWEFTTTASDILLRTIMPDLESLDICIASQIGRSLEVWDRLIDCLSRCPALRELALENFHLSRRDMRRAVGCVPNVERLVWWDRSESTMPNLLKVLTLPRNQNDEDGLFEDPAPFLDDPILPLLPAVDDYEDSNSDEDADGFFGVALPHLSSLEIGGWLDSREKVKLVQRMVVSRSLQRVRTTDVAPLRHLVLKSFNWFPLAGEAHARVADVLSSFTIHDHVRERRDVVSFEQEEEEEGPLATIDCP